MDLLQQALAPLLVLALLGAALWFAKARPRLSLNKTGPKRMQVIERVSLTPQHTLCLVRIGERLVMIGTAPTSCQLLQSLEDSPR
jgi:flagellar biogenesis protein FliO